MVIADLPGALSEWTEPAPIAAHRVFAAMEIDMRSARNMLRFLRALPAEDLPADKVEFVMNRAPCFDDPGGKGRLRKMAETLGIECGCLLPEAGRAVAEACDHGSPMAQFAGRSGLRRAIRKTACADPA